MAKILVTGSAGFIGFHLTKRLLNDGYEVCGLDNINDYYDVNLKYARLKELGIYEDNISYNKYSKSDLFSNHKFIKLSLEDKENLTNVFKLNKFELVINLAAQAGVRYSIENPDVYIQSNVVGFLNILEACRSYSIKHLLYASSSSVYGMNAKIPFSVEDRVDNPVSLYAATKKANELMAYTYSHLYNFHTTGLRFFTVYGPWGRPDMSPIIFAKAIINEEPIQVFNNGKMQRDFTYIDDIIDGVMHIVNSHENVQSNKEILYNLYNIGNSKPIKLLDFIETLEKEIGKKAKKIMKPMQPGDVTKTWADVDGLKKDFGYSPDTNIKVGIKNFIDWFKIYCKGE